MKTHHSSECTPDLTLVLGATGKTGRRVLSRLQDLHVPVRIGSRSASPPFDWTLPSSWDACLEGVTSAYVAYPSDLPIPGSGETIAAFIDRAVRRGVEHLVLLSGRGEEEARTWERAAQDAALDWTIIRASWFFQNFSEGAFREMVRAGQIALPAGDALEPFVDAEDIADVAAAALTDTRHRGQVYELTGPRLLTLADVAAETSRALGRPVDFEPVPHEAFMAEVVASGAPPDVIWTMDYLFKATLDGRNAYLTDDVERALGRPPTDYLAFAHKTARSGAWRRVA